MDDRSGRLGPVLGRLAQAESIFTQVWEEFRVRSFHQEVVLVTIDLAQVLTQQGEPERAAQLAAQSYIIMSHWGLHKDALAAWVLFQEALSRGLAFGDLFERLGTYYRRNWFKPARFDPNRS